MRPKSTATVDGLLALSLSIEQALIGEDWTTVNELLRQRDGYMDSLMVDEADQKIASKMAAVRLVDARLTGMMAKHRALAVREITQLASAGRAAQAYLVKTP